MADDQRGNFNVIEKAKIGAGNIADKEHFLEQGVESESRPEGGSRFEQIARPEKPGAAAGEKMGKDIIAQTAYNQQQETRKKEIEQILEKDLGDIYVSLPMAKQQQFRVVGEETAKKINDLFNRGKVKLKKIINLIRRWLSLIPGVNKFFLEQETKIKADEIFKINLK